jgi:hypothetical protein
MNVRRLPPPRVLPQRISRPGATPLYFSRAQSRQQQNEQFATDWLSQRDPRDLRARTKFSPLLQRPLAALPAFAIVDLACGAGSMPRALAPHVPAQQKWISTPG